MDRPNLLKYLKPIVPDYIIFTLLFFVASLIGILHHELWLDEAHHWLLARDSTSIANLITNARYEGHPILWNIILFYISRFSLNPFWMQLLHIIISSSVVFIFFKNAPFSRVFKILFIFGYFMFFEYNLLSRNYALGVLFLFLACSIYEHRKEKFILFAGFLALANNVHAIFIVITVCLMFTLCIEYIQKNKFRIPSKMIFGLVLFILGTLLAVIQIIPPSDTSFFERSEDISLFKRTYRSLITFFKGIYLISDFRTFHFWNTNLIVNLNKPLAGVLGILSLFIPCVLFFKNKTILLYVYLGIIGTAVFFFITRLSSPRYFGMNYLIIILGLWLNHYHPFVKNKINTLFSPVILEKTKKIILYTIIGIQFISGITAYSIDIAVPFTNSKQTIEFLNSNNLSNKIVVTTACDGTALSSYLQKQIFFTNRGSYQSYCIWGNSNTNTSYSEESLIKSLSELLKTSNQTVIFISYKTIFKTNSANNWIPINKKIKYRFLKKFEKSIINKGDYYIYEISKI